MYLSLTPRTEIISIRIQPICGISTITITILYDLPNMPCTSNLLLIFQQNGNQNIDNATQNKVLSQYIYIMLTYCQTHITVVDIFTGPFAKQLDLWQFRNHDWRIVESVCHRRFYTCQRSPTIITIKFYHDTNSLKTLTTTPKPLA